jgi:hypothetical protein
MSENKHQRPDDQRLGVPLQWDDTPSADTVQRLKHGDVPSTEITLRQAETLVEAFGGFDAEISIIQRPDAWPHLDLGLYAYFTECPEEGTFYLGPTEVDDDLAICGRVPAAPVRTWRERIGQPADFPLHAPTDVERAMEAEIAELRARLGLPPGCIGRAPREPDGRRVPGLRREVGMRRMQRPGPDHRVARRHGCGTDRARRQRRWPP